MAYPAAYKKAKKKATAKKKTITRKKRVVKKKRTAKQIAATKRLVAANKKRAAKRVGTSQTKKSMTTKKPPTKRLKKRRASNVKAGYYPNPISKKEQIEKAYYAALEADDEWGKLLKKKYGSKAGDYRYTAKGTATIALKKAKDKKLRADRKYQNLIRPKRKHNPVKKTRPRKWRVLCVVPSVAGINKGLDPKKTGYWTGTGWDTNKSKAVRFPNVQAARNTAAELPKKYRSGLYWSYATETV